MVSETESLASCTGSQWNEWVHNPESMCQDVKKGKIKLYVVCSIKYLSVHIQMFQINLKFLGLSTFNRGEQIYISSLTSFIICSFPLQSESLIWPKYTTHFPRSHRTSQSEWQLNCSWGPVLVIAGKCSSSSDQLISPLVTLHFTGCLLWLYLGHLSEENRPMAPVFRVFYILFIFLEGHSLFLLLTVFRHRLSLLFQSKARARILEILPL